MEDCKKILKNIVDKIMYENPKDIAYGVYLEEYLEEEGMEIDIILDKDVGDDTLAVIDAVYMDGQLSLDVFSFSMGDAREAIVVFIYNIFTLLTLENKDEKLTVVLNKAEIIDAYDSKMLYYKTIINGKEYPYENSIIEDPLALEILLIPHFLLEINKIPYGTDIYKFLMQLRHNLAFIMIAYEYTDVLDALAFIPILFLNAKSIYSLSDTATELLGNPFV